jgi:hypothetical protein
LQQPLYDTESLPAGAITEVIYFQRQLGQTMANAAVVKTVGETNLQQPGQLANPLEFSLFGFLYEVAPGCTLADFLLIYTTSVFTFTYTGNRIYLQVPLMRIPQGVSPEGFAAVAAGPLGAGGLVVHNGVGHVSHYYKFTIGRSALRIRPTEAFQARVAWPVASITLGAVTRTRAYITGLQWTPL